MSDSRRLGKYFLIKNQLKPHLVLEIRDGMDKPSAPVILAEYKSTSCADHQLWFLDLTTGTIRSKLNSFCISIKGDSVIVQPYFKDVSTQLWGISENKIQTKDDPDMVISVLDSVPKISSSCVKAKYTGTDGQHWIIEHVPAQLFYIRSMQDPKKVMDVKGDSTKAGAKVILYPDKGNQADNQLWYEDEAGIIRSKIKNFVLDAGVIQPFDNTNPNQQWVINGSHLRCKADEERVIEIKPSGVTGDTDLVATRFAHDQPLQNWIFEYISGKTNLNHRGTGKHFIIRNRASGLVLEVQGQGATPGTHLVTAYRNTDQKTFTNQLFYTEDMSGTVRTELNKYCVDAVGGQLVINPYDPYDKNQQWRLTGHKIHNREHQNLVWSVTSNSTEPGEQVVATAYDGSELQQWDVQYLPAKSFYIVSRMNSKVLDISGDNTSAGASVIMYDRKNVQAPNQLWYEDENGILRSKLNGYVLDSTKDHVKMQPFDPTNSGQYWVIVGDRIQNKYDNRLVLDIAGENKKNQAPLCAYRYMGGDNQHWTFDFV